MATNLQKTKLVARLIVGTAVSFIVTAAIKQNVMPKNMLQKAFIVIGGFALGNMIATKAETWTSGSIDEIVSTWKNAKIRYIK